MMYRLAGLLVVAFSLLWTVSAQAEDFIEPPSLAADVAAGKLPPVAKRLPDEPRVIDMESMGREIR